MPVTYKNLYSQIDELIDKKIRFSTTEDYKNQSSRSGVEPYAIASRTSSDTSVQELVNAIQSILSDALPVNIISGLTVVATDPVTDQVTVAAGKGAVAGYVYELTADTTLTIPFEGVAQAYYISLYQNTIQIDRSTDSSRLVIAKIVVPLPGTSNRVRDKDDGSYDAYIMQRKEFKFYGDAWGNLEEDSMEIFRNNMGEILADTIVGTLTVGENLKIENVLGTVAITSEDLRIKNFNQDVLAKFDKNGVFFYQANGVEIAKFSSSGARIGNITINPTDIRSTNFVEGSTGFRLQDDGNVEFNNLIVRGTIYANAGTIGGFTIDGNSLYATTTGTIKTGANVASGQNGVIMDMDGIRGYSSVLGTVFNLPSDGSAPTFASGIITSVIFELTTASIIRTSETVGDGSADSAGLLMNNTGLYGCEASQSLADANFKILQDGSIYLKGEIQATSGNIGGVEISSTQLTGGTIVGATIRGAVIETSASIPKVRMDSTGIYFQVSTSVGKYGASGSGLGGFQYGDGTVYGAGVTAYLFRDNSPILAILAEQIEADIRFYNRSSDPSSGTHEIGDVIVTSGALKVCTTGGTPGTFTAVGDGIGADTDLSNLASVAINTSLISDTNNTDDLGSDAKEWKDIWIDGVGYFDSIQMHGNLDFNDNQAIDFILENRTDDTGMGVTGQMWFRTDV